MSHIAVVRTRAAEGVHAPAVTVEVHLSASQIAGFSIVGLPEAEVRESRDRVRAALASSALDFPFGRLTVNLAPAASTWPSRWGFWRCRHSCPPSAWWAASSTASWV